MLAGIKQWQLAEAMGISETHLSRKLRKELPQEEKQNILDIIERLSKEKKEVV
jgi:predicted XRE-type DNA-binding protein